MLKLIIKKNEIDNIYIHLIIINILSFIMIINNNELNKDIIINSLFDYICKLKNLNKLSFFQNITENHILNNVLNNLNPNEPTNVFTNILDGIINDTPKNLEIECINNIIPIKNSRYENDFMEINKISSGGFGTVYKTMHKLDMSIYAIKKIPIKSLNIDSKVLNEAKILANLSHNNIIRYYSTWIEQNNSNILNNNFDSDSFEYSNSFTSNSNHKMLTYNSESEDIDNLYTSSESNSNNKLVLHEQNKLFSIIIYIQMEACKMNLKEYISQTNLIDINNIIKDILSAVKYIHSKNIIHCDLSLINILVDDNDIIKICDFGLAEDIGNSDHIIKYKTYGNLIYCAPESIQFNKYSYKSDIYSLGIVFYELLNKFSTEMERLTMIKKFKNKEIDSKYDKILYNMIHLDQDVRPFINDISIKHARKFLSKK